MAGQVTNHAPFEVPQTLRKSKLWAERKIPDDYTDGDARHFPGAPQYHPCPDGFYLCQLGQKWAEKDGIAQPGIQYYIDKLPNGFAMFETSGPQFYKRLFGHPTGKFYDSALKFEPHFLWLMSGMDGDCHCVLCAKKGAKAVAPIRPRAPREVVDRTTLGSRSFPRGLPDGGDRRTSSRDSSAGHGIANKRAQRPTRQPGPQLAVDEEGTEDIYKDCVRKLEQGGKRGVEIDLSEDGSIDWIADRQCLPQYLTQIEQQHCFIPRIGELVLWIPTFMDQHHLMLDPSTSEYKFYSFEQQCFHGFPAWRGGVVVAVPSASVKNSPIDFTDILSTPVKKTAFNTAGFRIESLPDPNENMNKAMSKEYRYVPMRNIRPLTHWQLLLRGIHDKKLHPSVMHALTCMTSISLLEKWRFNGEWPHARVFCKGVYLGSELITVGDTIRLQPAGAKGDLRPDVLVVDSIRYILLDIEPEHTLSETPLLCSRSSITFVGSAYTNDLTKLSQSQAGNNAIQTLPSPLQPSEVKTRFRSVGAEEYGRWYPWHGPKQKYEVSHELVTGRLYEADAVRLWNGQRQISRTQRGDSKPSLSFDTNSILAGRRYATATDARLPEPQSKLEINWYLSDSRAEALAVATINGIDVGKYHDIRTPLTLKSWRIQVKVADGQIPSSETTDDPYIKDLTTIDLGSGKRRGRPVGAKVIDGKLVLPGQYHDGDSDHQVKAKSKPTSQMAGAALISDQDSSEDYSEGDSDDGEENDVESDVENLSLKVAASTVTQAAPALTKTNIMSFTEIDDESFDEDFAELASWSKNPPPVRGGTEESEGGDYRE